MKIAKRFTRRRSPYVGSSFAEEMRRSLRSAHNTKALFEITVMLSSDRPESFIERWRPSDNMAELLKTLEWFKIGHAEVAYAPLGNAARIRLPAAKLAAKMLCGIPFPEALCQLTGDEESFPTPFSSDDQESTAFISIRLHSHVAMIENIETAEGETGTEAYEAIQQVTRLLLTRPSGLFLSRT